MPIFNSFYLEQGNKVNPAILQRKGPVVPVEVHPPNSLMKYLSDQKLPLPQPATGYALFDTGASMTCVDNAIIQSLGVQSVGEGKVFTPSGEALQSLYPSKLVFPTLSSMEVNFNSVFGAQLKFQNIIALIGRDVLRNMVLTYNGPGGFVTISI